MNMAEMAKEVAAFIVDGMDIEDMEIYLRATIEDDFLAHPEKYTYEVEDVKQLLAEADEVLVEKEERYED